MATRGRPKGGSKSPGSGRQKGTPDKVVMTEKLRADLWQTYLQLGQQKFLLEYAKSDPDGFIKNCLSRLLPAFQSPPREPLVEINQVVKIDQLSEFEIARRIAFALNKASHALDGTSVISSKTIAPPAPAPAEPTPLEYPLAEQAKAQADEALTRDNIYGSAAEQGRRRLI